MLDEKFHPVAFHMLCSEPVLGAPPSSLDGLPVLRAREISVSSSQQPGDLSPQRTQQVSYGPSEPPPTPHPKVQTQP